MASSISTTLYAWLTTKRITREVARRLGMPHSTLSAALQGDKTRSKLGVDELLPLLRVVREMGYGHELDRVMKRFVKEVGGEVTPQVEVETFGDLLLGVVQGIGELSKSATRVNALEGRKELVQLKTIIRGEIIPAVYKLEDIIDSRLAKTRRQLKFAGYAESHPMPAGD